MIYVRYEAHGIGSGAEMESHTHSALTIFRRLGAVSRAVSRGLGCGYAQHFFATKILSGSG